MEIVESKDLQVLFTSLTEDQRDEVTSEDVFFVSTTFKDTFECGPDEILKFGIEFGMHVGQNKVFHFYSDETEEHCYCHAPTESEAVQRMAGIADFYLAAKE